MEFKRVNKKAETIDSAELERRMQAWPDSYYAEREAGIRLALLDEACARGLTPEDNRIRREFFSYRYVRRKDLYEDRFLRAITELVFINGNLKSRFGRGRNIRGVRNAMKLFHEEDAKAMGENGPDLLSREIYHCAMLYIALCNEDKFYRSLIMGIGRMKEEQVNAKIANDFYAFTVEIPAELQLAEEMRFFTEPTKKAFSDFYPEFRYILEEVNRGENN